MLSLLLQTIQDYMFFILRQNALVAHGALHGTVLCKAIQVARHSC
jgi:hypothetical protein